MELANDVRQFGVDHGFGSDPEQIAQAHGWTVTHGPLGAPTDGVDAVLVPAGASFQCLVDPNLARRERWQCAGESSRRCTSLVVNTRRFRVAHELAHSAFYGAGKPPRRIAAVSVEEERFCDDFALALLVPPEHLALLPASAEGIERLSQSPGVTPALVAMAAVHHGNLVAVVAGTLEGTQLRVEWHVGLDFDPSGWALPLPSAEGSRSAWRDVFDDPSALTWWADDSKAIIAIA